MQLVQVDAQLLTLKEDIENEPCMFSREYYDESTHSWTYFGPYQNIYDGFFSKNSERLKANLPRKLRRRFLMES